MGLKTDCREVLATKLLDAEPDHKYQLPGDSVWPLALAIATAGTIVGALFTPWAIPVGAVFVFAALAGWFWQGSDPHAIVSQELGPKKTEPAAPGRLETKEGV